MPGGPASFIALWGTTGMPLNSCEVGSAALEATAVTAAAAFTATTVVAGEWLQVWPAAPIRIPLLSPPFSRQWPGR